MNRFFNRNFAGQRGVVRNIQNDEKKTPLIKTTQQSRLSFKFEGETRSFIEKQKLKEFITTQLLFQEMLKGIL